MNDGPEAQLGLSDEKAAPAPPDDVATMGQAAGAKGATLGKPAGPPASPIDGPRQLARSKRIGGVSEIAVLAPIRKGLVPGERRSFEERLRSQIASLAERHEKGIPVELDRITTIHFGRMLIIRPEQYLMNPNWPKSGDRQVGISAALEKPFDDFVEIDANGVPEAAHGDPHQYHSLLGVIVGFDGDIKVYMHEIAKFIGRDFDLLFNNCERYPGSANFESFWAWIRTFQIELDLFYSTYPNLSVVRLKQLERFKRRFDAFVARVRAPGRGNRPIDDLLDEFLQANQQYGVDFPTPNGIYPRGE
jgi:hypothetical protein